MGLFNNSSYLTSDQADDYFAGRFNSSAWHSATVEEKTAALLDATRRIDRLNFAGVRTADVNNRLQSVGEDGVLVSSDILLPTSPGQPNEFPRNGDTTVPEEILAACCEIAYALIDGVDPELEAQSVGITSQGFAAIRESFDSRVVNLAFRNGIPSVTAWNYLYPFLQPPSEVKLIRV